MILTAIETEVILVEVISVQQVEMRKQVVQVTEDNQLQQQLIEIPVGEMPVQLHLQDVEPAEPIHKVLKAALIIVIKNIRTARETLRRLVILVRTEAIPVKV